MPLDAVPEFSPLSLHVRTEALGVSAAAVESLTTCRSRVEESVKLGR
jgi:Cu/Ag efflux pump CusA